MKNEKSAYKIFNIDGKEAAYSGLLEDALSSEIILFGEIHDNPICHWLELELTKSLFQKKGKDLILGAEMFEADNSLILNEYLKGLISESSFESEARLWSGYETCYKPLLDYAEEMGLPFIATNIPRRYASVVHRGGFDALEGLSGNAKEFIAPGPIAYNQDLQCYYDMLEMTKEMGDETGDDNLPKAQAVKDATMAHFILQNFSKGRIFIHFNGTYHSDNYEGIAWYLKQEKPDIEIFTIASVEQEDIQSLDADNKGLGNYILCMPSSMTRTG